MQARQVQSTSGDSVRIIGGNLKRCEEIYGSYSLIYGTKINNILSGSKSKKHHIDHIKHLDSVDFDSKKELLFTFFTRKWSNVNLQKLIHFYRFHSDIPRFFDQEFLPYIDYFHNLRREAVYQRVARLIGEENIVGSSGLPANDSQHKPSKPRCSFSTLLLNLDITSNHKLDDLSLSSVIKVNDTAEDISRVEVCNLFSKPRLSQARNKIVDPESTQNELYQIYSNANNHRGFRIHSREEPVFEGLTIKKMGITKINLNAKSKQLKIRTHKRTLIKNDTALQNSLSRGLEYSTTESPTLQISERRRPNIKRKVVGRQLSISGRPKMNERLILESHLQSGKRVDNLSSSPIKRRTNRVANFRSIIERKNTIQLSPVKKRSKPRVIWS